MSAVSPLVGFSRKCVSCSVLARWRQIAPEARKSGTGNASSYRRIPAVARDASQVFWPGGNMSVLRRTLLFTPAALVMIHANASSAHALPPADRTLFTWNGTIDREVIIVVRGRSVQTRAAGLDASFAPRLDVRDGLPREGGLLSVRKLDGRGDVDVLEQPSARNDYTARVRVRDPRGGRDNYRLIASWVPLGFGDDRRGNDDWNRGNRGRDDDWNEGNRGRGNDDRADDRDKRGRGRGNDGWNDRDADRGNGRWGNNRGGNRGGNRGDRDAGSLAFRGDVDDVLDIRIQGRRVEYITRSGKRVRNVRADIDGRGLPQRPVRLDLDVSRGRGSVIVLQQPTPRNGYTAVVRVVDKRSGYGGYDFDLYWR